MYIHITSVDYADYLALLAILAWAESKLCSLKQTTRGIGIFVNADNTKMCFKPDDNISLLNNGKHLKFVDHLIYLASNISSTESDANILICKAWTAIDRLSTI